MAHKCDLGKVEFYDLFAFSVVCSTFLLSVKSSSIFDDLYFEKRIVIGTNASFSHETFITARRAKIVPNTNKEIDF